MNLRVLIHILHVTYKAHCQNKLNKNLFTHHKFEPSRFFYFTSFLSNPHHIAHLISHIYATRQTTEFSKMHITYTSSSARSSCSSVSSSFFFYFCQTKTIYFLPRRFFSTKWFRWLIKIKPFNINRRLKEFFLFFVRRSAMKTQEIVEKFENKIEHEFTHMAHKHTYLVQMKMVTSNNNWLSTKMHINIKYCTSLYIFLLIIDLNLMAFHFLNNLISFKTKMSPHLLTAKIRFCYWLIVGTCFILNFSIKKILKKKNKNVCKGMVLSKLMDCVVPLKTESSLIGDPNILLHLFTKPSLPADQ